MMGELYRETAYIIEERFRINKFKTYEERLKDYSVDAVKKWEKSISDQRADEAEQNKEILATCETEYI